MPIRRNENTLYLSGVVGAGFFADEYFTHAELRAALDEIDGDVTAFVNSGGGSASEGLAMAAAFKDHDGAVDLRIEGIAASAASVLAMGASTISIAEGSMMMIHDPATITFGDAKAHEKSVEMLGTFADSSATIYSKKSGKSKDAVREIMEAETWFTAEEAVEEGFADQVLNSDVEDVEMSVIISFPYQIYQNAPETVLRATGDQHRGLEPAVVMSVITGQTAPKQEASMAKPNEKPSGTPKEPVVENSAANKTVVNNGPTEAEVAAAAQKAADDAVQAERTRVSQIADITMKAGLDDAFQVRMINEGKSVDEVRQEAIDAWAENGGASAAPRPTPRTQMLRDERDTMRVGMEASLVAQIAGETPSDDRANAFMDMGIVEMAASFSGITAPMRNATQRMEVMMNASHSRSDFPAIFENALNKVLQERYQIQAPTYREISRKKNFNDFRPHPITTAGDTPRLQKVAENGEIKWGTFGEAKESAILTAYGVGVTISRQMIVDDDMGGINEVLSDHGSMISDFEEAKFYAFLEAATLTDGDTIFHANHANLASSGAAPSVTTLSNGRKAMRKQTSIDGNKAPFAPSILLVGPEQETKADQLTAPIAPTQETETNPFRTLRPLTTAHIDGNEWYMFANPSSAGAAVVTYGYLNGSEAPRLRSQDLFGRQGMSYTIEHDFGLGAVNYRGAWKNPGQ